MVSNLPPPFCLSTIPTLAFPLQSPILSPTKPSTHLAPISPVPFQLPPTFAREAKEPGQRGPYSRQGSGWPTILPSPRPRTPAYCHPYSILWGSRWEKWDSR